MPSDRHELLVAHLVEDGWEVGNWRRAVRDRVKEDPFCGLEGCDAECIAYEIKQAPITPDAFRLKVEGEAEGWGEPVLVVELAEVVISNDLSPEKLGWYDWLWQGFDAASNLHMRLYVIDRHGIQRIVLDGSCLEPDRLPACL